MNLWHVPWKTVLAATDILVDKLPPSSDVWALARGGYIPGALVARRLKANLHLIALHEKLEGQLIVDDIADSGTTFLAFPKCDAAVLFSRIPDEPIYYGLKVVTSRWLVFPWECSWIARFACRQPIR